VKPSPYSRRVGRFLKEVLAYAGTKISAGAHRTNSTAVGTDVLNAQEPQYLMGDRRVLSLCCGDGRQMDIFTSPYSEEIQIELNTTRLPSPQSRITGRRKQL